MTELHAELDHVLRAVGGDGEAVQLRRRAAATGARGPSPPSVTRSSRNRRVASQAAQWVRWPGWSRKWPMASHARGTTAVGPEAGRPSPTTPLPRCVDESLPTGSVAPSDGSGRSVSGTRAAQPGERFVRLRRGRAQRRGRRLHHREPAAGRPGRFEVVVLLRSRGFGPRGTSRGDDEWLTGATPIGPFP